MHWSVRSSNIIIWSLNPLLLEVSKYNDRKVKEDLFKYSLKINIFCINEANKTVTP